jgi:hypothetical protein
MPYEDFNDIIKKVGEETALLVGSQCDDWFQFNIADLTPTIEERNQLLHELRSAADLPPSILDSMRTHVSTRMSKTKYSSPKHDGPLMSVPKSMTCKQIHASRGNIFDYSLAAQLLITRRK